MSLLNTQRTALFLKSGAVLPVPVDGFLEVTAPILIVPTIASEDYKRISGKLNATDSFADTCNSQVSFTADHLMRSNNIAADALMTVPEYGELLKTCGFDENVDITTGGQEFVEYTNSQTPVLSSAVAYVDGKKFEMTNSMTSDMTMEFQIGQPAKITANLQGYIDSAEAIDEATPVVALSEEPLMIVSCASVTTLGGTVLQPDRVTFSTNPEIADFYTMGGANGLKAKAMTDYALTCTLDFFPDSADYNREILSIKNQTTATLDIKIATDDTAALINGKSLHVTCEMVKVQDYTDTDESNVAKRSVTYKVSNGAGDVALKIKAGFFA